MNKFAALGLLEAAAQGKTVLVVEHTQGAAREALREFEPIAEEASSWVRRIRRANGGERIDMISGGRITFTSHRSSIRGMTADVVFIDWGVETDDPHFVDRAMHLIAGRPDAEIIRA